MQWTDITGHLKPEEGEELRRLASGKTVLEIGAWRGRSTVAMAQVAARVHSIDPHTAATFKDVKPHDSLPALRNNLKRFGVAEKVVIHLGLSEDVLPLLAAATFDLVFVDGNHDAEHATFDVSHALRLVKSGGAIACHDYKTGRPRHAGVDVAVEGLLCGRITKIVHKLAVAEGITPSAYGDTEYAWTDAGWQITHSARKRS